MTPMRIMLLLSCLSFLICLVVAGIAVIQAERIRTLERADLLAERRRMQLEADDLGLRLAKIEMRIRHLELTGMRMDPNGLLGIKN